jgi:hypothetical protein
MLVEEFVTRVVRADEGQNMQSSDYGEGWICANSCMTLK